MKYGIVHHNSLVFLCGHSMVQHDMVWFGMVWASCVAPTAGDDGESTPAPPTAPNTPQEQTSHQTQSHFYRKQKKTKANSFCTMQCLNGNPVQYFLAQFPVLDLISVTSLVRRFSQQSVTQDSFYCINTSIVSMRLRVIVSF